MDFRKGSAAPLYINGNQVETVHSFRFLSMQICDDLSWSVNITAVVKKAQQQLRFLRVLRKNNLEEKLLVAFYRTIVEGTLAYCISVWYTGCSAADRRALQMVINTTPKITGCSLTCLEDMTSSRCHSRASSII